MASPTPQKSIFPSMIFISWVILKEEVENWAVAEHFSFRVLKKVQSRVDYCCHDKNCPWFVFVSLSKAGDITTIIVKNKHTCTGVKQISYDISNTQSWLQKTVPKHLFVT